MKKQLVFSLFTAALVFSCSKDSTVMPPPIPSTQDNMRLCATAGQMTKTELCGCQDIQWMSGDKLSVWEAGNTSNSNVQFTLVTESEGKTVGDFTGSLTPAGDPFTLYSIYPYKDSYGDNPEAVTLTIPAEISQCDDVNDLVGDMDFMMGHCSSSEYDSETGTYRMLFHHPLAFIQLHIDGRDCVFREATLKTLTMTADVAFVGDVTADLTAGTITSAATGDAGKSLVVNFPSTARMSDAQDAWIAINPVDLTNANCHFILEMTNGQKVDFKVNPKVMVEQSLYKFDFSDIDTKIASKKGTPTYVDLVAINSGERANCYIVSEGGYYRFAAQRVDKTNCFEGNNPASNGYKADWLWATGTKSKVSGVNFGNSGNINFRVEPASNGNTVIALYDPDGNIVWSWHIWCTEADCLDPTHYSRNNAWLVSDINVGATSKTDGDVNTYGMYYQWGRKDPFPADKTACVFNEGVVMKGYDSKSTDVVAGAVAYSIAHPTVFLYANDYQTWISNSSDAVNAQSLWNNPTNNTKSNYDPCPAGYRVPRQNDYAWQNLFVAGNMSWGTNGFTYNHAEGGRSYYPYGGYLNGLTLTDAGATARCWAANLSATPTATTNMQGRSLLVTKSSREVKTSQTSRAAFGLNVRCMKK